MYISERSNYDYWKIPLLSISIDGVLVPSAISRSKIHGSVSPIAVLDTGTTLILGPSHDVDNFWTAAGGAQKGEDGRWKVRCNHALLVGFVLGNDSTRREIVLDPSDINWVPPAASLPADGWCLGGIQSNDGVCDDFSLLLRPMNHIHLAQWLGLLRRLAFRGCFPKGKIDT